MVDWSAKKYGASAKQFICNKLSKRLSLIVLIPFCFICTIHFGHGADFVIQKKRDIFERKISEIAQRYIGIQYEFGGDLKKYAAIDNSHLFCLIYDQAKEALQARKAAGVKLGRPKGPGKSKLDPFREEIVALLKTGSTKTYLARKYETSLPNLYNWLKKNKITIKAEL